MDWCLLKVRQLLATFQAPLSQFVMLLNAPAQNFVYLLAAKEREGAATK